MLPPYFFLGPAVAPPTFFIPESPLAQTPLNAAVDAITHVHCYVEYSLLTIGAREDILLRGQNNLPWK